MACLGEANKVIMTAIDSINTGSFGKHGKVSLNFLSPPTKKKNSKRKKTFPVL